MKIHKYIKIIIVIPFLLLSAGCNSPTPKGHFVEGRFYGVFEEQEYYFVVKNITEQEYSNLNGINAVKSSKNNPPYFKCELYYFDINDNKQYLYFENMVDGSPWANPYYFVKSSRNSEDSQQIVRDSTIYCDDYSIVDNNYSEEINYSNINFLEELEGRHIYHICYVIKEQTKNDSNILSKTLLDLDSYFFSFEDIEKCSNLNITWRE